MASRHEFDGWMTPHLRYHHYPSDVEIIQLFNKIGADDSLEKKTENIALEHS